MKLVREKDRYRLSEGFSYNQIMLVAKNETKNLPREVAALLFWYTCKPKALIDYRSGWSFQASRGRCSGSGTGFEYHCALRSHATLKSSHHLMDRRADGRLRETTESALSLQAAASAPIVQKIAHVTSLAYLRKGSSLSEAVRAQNYSRRPQ